VAKLVGPAGFEPATLGLEIRCSIRLSYGPIHLNAHFTHTQPIGDGSVRQRVESEPGAGRKKVWAL
jgi:hypothetical protein